MYLCPYVSEEGVDGEGPGSEVSSLLSHTLRYDSLVELVTLFLLDRHPSGRYK